MTELKILNIVKSVAEKFYTPTQRTIIQHGRDGGGLIEMIRMQGIAFRDHDNRNSRRHN